MEMFENTLKVAILGTGKIGTDLLIKINRSEHLECTLFAGRNFGSVGMRKAEELGVPTSDGSIDAILAHAEDIDVVFDATSAEHHRAHAPRLAAAGIKAVDLTPAKMGPYCIPSLTGNSLGQENNINMVTCGGQATIPMLEAIVQAFPQAKSIDVKTLVTPDSVGPATFANIDDYKATTSNAIYKYTGINNAQIALEVDEDPSREKMSSILTIGLDECDLKKLATAMKEREALMQEYVPGYHISAQPNHDLGVLTVEISVKGTGDWIPAHAGNLDIINCAAIEAVERYAVQSAYAPKSFWEKTMDFLKKHSEPKRDWKIGQAES